MKILQDRAKVLESQKGQISPDIDSEFLNRYEKVLLHKNGLAIAPVLSGSTCGGCYMNVTPQMHNAMKMYDSLVSCELCSRILYSEEDL